MKTSLSDLPSKPGAIVLLCDIDGTLAPIVDDPDKAAVPADHVQVLEAARERCALVAAISGRSLSDATRMLPLEGIWIAACHGMHMRAPDGSEQVDAIATRARPQLDITVQMAQTVGWRYEDKGLSVTLHFRHTARPELTAGQMRAQISTVLDPTVVELHDARMALEVRPRGAATKRDAVARLVGAAPPHAHHVVYVGDDRTDLDAFAALADCELDALRVAVDSDEAPRELLDAADVVLAGQRAVLPMLRRIAGLDAA